MNAVTVRAIESTNTTKSVGTFLKMPLITCVITDTINAKPPTTASKIVALLNNSYISITPFHIQALFNAI